MLVVLVPDAADAPAVARLLPASAPAPVVALEEWPRVLRVARQADAALVVLSPPHADATVRVLRALRRRLPHLGLVGLATLDPECVRAALRARVDEVVFWHDGAAVVQRACAAAPGLSLRQAAAALARRSRRLPPALREAVARACERRPLVTSTGELAALVSCHRSTLHRRLRDPLTADAPPPGLRESLDWLRVLHAAASRRPLARWADMAEALPIDVRAMRRAARVALGDAAERLPTMRAEALLARFAEWLAVAADRTGRSPVGHDDGGVRLLHDDAARDDHAAAATNVPGPYAIAAAS